MLNCGVENNYEIGSQEMLMGNHIQLSDTVNIYIYIYIFNIYIYSVVEIPLSQMVKDL